MRGTRVVPKHIHECQPRGVREQVLACTNNRRSIWLDCRRATRPEVLFHTLRIDTRQGRKGGRRECGPSSRRVGLRPLPLILQSSADCTEQATLLEPRGCTSLLLCLPISPILRLKRKRRAAVFRWRITVCLWVERYATVGGGDPGRQCCLHTTPQVSTHQPDSRQGLGICAQRIQEAAKTDVCREAMRSEGRGDASNLGQSTSQFRNATRPSAAHAS